MNATLPLSQSARCECQKTPMILIIWPACMLSIGILTLHLEENTLSMCSDAHIHNYQQQGTLVRWHLQ